MTHQQFLCRKIYSNQQWKEDQLISVDTDGMIVDISPANHNDSVTLLDGILIPGFQNCHSHSFQYLIAGLTETASNAPEDFWTWRQLYKITKIISPEDLYTITCTAYLDMLRAGYVSVTEFHYLHHPSDADRYSDQAIMAKAIMEAANTVGINLCLVPVYYNRSGFGKNILEEQKPFYSKNLESYLSLLSDIEEAGFSANTVIGTGVHSLRAASLEDTKEILNHPSSVAARHIHIAEQVKEVSEFENIYRQRPVAWLLDNVDAPTSLVHATHLTQKEMENLAKSHHTAVICPTTEANLGDGIFPFVDYVKQGGFWSVGSDSQVCIDPLIELQSMDYIQRLITKRRNPIKASDALPYSSGNHLFNQALANSARSSSFKLDLSVGSQFTGLLLDPDSTDIYAVPNEKIFDCLIYKASQRSIKMIMNRGQVVLDKNTLINEGVIHSNYRTLKKRFSKSLH